MKKTVFSIMVAASLLSWCSYAEELRVWTAVNGQTIEAKFIQMSGLKVVLETTDSKRIMITKSNLCAADQKYLADVIPPELKIDIDKDVDSRKLHETDGYTEKQETVTLNIVIKKLNPDPCTRKFKAHVYFIGEAPRSGKRKVVAQKEQDVSFLKHNTVKFAATATMQHDDYGPEYSFVGHVDFGWEFEGYILVIKDETGQAIAVESNKSTYKASLAKIEKKKNERDGFDL